MRRTRQACRGQARSLRTNETCVWGVSDPRKPVPGPCSGGGRGGRSRPDASVTAADSLPTATRAAKSAARSTRAKLLIVRDIAMCDMRSRSRRPRVGQTKYASHAGGPLLPRLWSPRFFFASEFWRPHPRGNRARLYGRRRDPKRPFDSGATELDIEGSLTRLADQRSAAELRASRRVSTTAKPFINLCRQGVLREMQRAGMSPGRGTTPAASIKRCQPLRLASILVPVRVPLVDAPS